MHSFLEKMEPVGKWQKIEELWKRGRMTVMGDQLIRCEGEVCFHQSAGSEDRTPGTPWVRYAGRNLGGLELPKDLRHGMQVCTIVPQRPVLPESLSYPA